MKKLISILTITTLTVNIPAPLLANTPLTRVKRDVGSVEKDVTTGFDIKIKDENKWIKEVKKNKAKNETLPSAEQQWICIAIDEAHLLINENNILTLNFLFKMTKRIRKYNAILYIITQNIAVFMGNKNIKTQAQGIINNCLYQFVHHLAPSDLNDYDDLISASGRLNQYQKDIIASVPIGVCLFTIGSNQRTIINIKTNPIEIKTIGNNPEKGEFRVKK